jgi:hypothetical protein
MSNFMKIRPAGAELFHVDMHTGMRNLTVTFAVLRKRPMSTESQCLTHSAVCSKGPIIVFPGDKFSGLMSPVPSKISFEKRR